MTYAILRIIKLKTFGRISAAGNHNLRLKYCSNANPEKRHLNVNLVDKGSSLTSAVKARLFGAGIKKWRKDAVLASELLLTASPEFFEKGASTEAWIAENHRWLVETFGDNIVSAVVHMDEMTPHIHCILVPIDRNGRLSHKNLFGGARDAFVEWQTNYAKRMTRFGLERGVCGSTATHERIRQFYTAVNATPEVVLDRMPIRPDLEQMAETVGVFRKERVIPVNKAEGLVRSYRAKLKDYIAGIVYPLHAQIDRLKRQLRQSDKVLRENREWLRQTENQAVELQIELNRSQRTTEHLTSFIKIAEGLFPDIVAKVTKERARIANAEMIARESRSAGVKGALAPLGTHSTLLKQRVGSLGQKIQRKTVPHTPF